VPPPLSCSVRSCGLALERRDRTFVCRRGHSFDVARAGYVNLLQPQDRRSREPGDRKAAIEARVALERAGVGRALIDEVVARAGGKTARAGGVVVDLGSGTGEALGALAAAGPITGVGLDLSTAAAAHAARRLQALTWVVANADRRLPLLDLSVDLVLSLHGRRNAMECARVLRPGGILVAAVPAPDDLIELRTVVQGRGVEHDRVPALVAGHAPWFTLRERAPVRTRHRLERAELLALLGATYRGARTSAARTIAALQTLEVTVASEICVFQLTSGAGGARHTSQASSPKPQAPHGSSPIAA